jgi:heme/copper-type cytochrome/quinol oxidase subunit 2
MTSRFSSLAGMALGLVSVVPVASLAQRPGVHEIRIEARKFEFEPAVIEVTAGEPVRLVLHSADATHGFEIKDLTLNLKLPRSGESVTAEFNAPPPGRYAIDCSKVCGLGHHKMKAALVSVPVQRPDTTR